MPLQSGPRVRHHALVRRRTVTIAAILVVVMVVGGLIGWRQYGRSADRKVCRVLQELDGNTFDPALVERIRRVGREARTHLGKIVRNPDGRTNPGHLFLNTEDYDYAVGRCFELGVPAPRVDPAGGSATGPGRP